MNKLYWAALLFVVYVLVLSCIYYAHVRFFSVDVVFYSALLDVVISVFVMALVLSFVSKNVHTVFEKFLLVIVFFLVGYCFAISVPTVIDRSLSLYILEKLQQRGGSIRLDRMGDVFTREYLHEHRLVDVRMTEQVKSGNIVIDGECVRLTGQGNHVATASRYFRQNFLPTKRLLMGQYTDVLTDPFRNSAQEYDYGCD